MILQKRIPKELYKLFRTRNMEHYMAFLVRLYEENMQAYMSLGLTEQECRTAISDTMRIMRIQWEVEVDEEEIEDNSESNFAVGTPAGILYRLVSWGWLKKDFDEKINRYIYTFPEYSQLYIELFQYLQTEDDSRERESILSIYSALYTYQGDKEKNNDILRNAVQTCRKLSQLLTNMQDGIRNYFEELSKQQNFRGVQEVLIEEMNNSDSKKYAILTTTDSFYRYKEEIKELISRILIENDLFKDRLYSEQRLEERGTLPHARLERKIELCEDASQMIYQLEREFDLMEHKYKNLIQQKSTFAKRALAKMRYIIQEGSNKEDYLMQWLQVLHKSENPDKLLEKTGAKMGFTMQYQIITDHSFSKRIAQGEHEFKPVSVQRPEEHSKEAMGDFIPKPLYTKKQLRDFRNKNMQDGRFVTTLDTVQSVEDLEKLLFLWQEATENMNESKVVELGEELVKDSGLSYRKLTIIED